MAASGRPAIARPAPGRRRRGHASMMRRPRLGDEPVSLRELVVDMIEECARHDRHTGLLRECIDGRVRSVAPAAPTELDDLPVTAAPVVQSRRHGNG
jgi:hypothetical protein